MTSLHDMGFADTRDPSLLRSKLAAALESMTDAVFISDTAGRFVDFNEAFVTFHRFADKKECATTLQEYPGILEVRFESGEPVPLEMWAVPRALRGEVVTNAVYGLRRKDTGEEWIGSYSFAPIRDEDGTIVGSVVVGRDITEAKRSEKALRESEERFSRAFHGSPAAQMITTVPEGRVLDVNAAYCRLLGFERGELLGRLSSETGLWADLSERQRILEELRLKGRVVDRELVLRAKSGELRTVLGWLEPIELSGEPCAISTVLDVTERRKAEAAAQESETRFRTLVDNAPEGVFVQRDGVLRYVNSTFAGMMGAEGPDRMLGTRVLDWVAPAFQEIAKGRISELMRVKALMPPREQDFVRVDGSIAPVETTAVPVTFEGLESYLVFVRDIAERRGAEADRAALEDQLRQATKMESIGRLAGGVAHDFNNILMVQKGYCELMRDSLSEDDPLAVDLAQIDACTERAAALTRQLLAFSRKQPLEPRIMDMGALVGRLDEMLRRLLGEDVDLKIERPATPAQVLADPGQMEQVLINLAANARDAMPNGGELTIGIAVVDLDENYAQTRLGMSGGWHVLVRVSDQGAGMDEVTRNRLFEPFFTTKPEGKGTGLGLSTVYGIVSQSGGSILVESEVGRGTTFRIYLPRVEGEPVPQVARDGRVTDGEGQLVLVVEDEPVLRKLAVSMLSRLGYEAVAAENGAAALELVEEGLRPALAITDVVMPGMNGQALVERLRAILPDLRVIFMSGYANDAISHNGVMDADVVFLQKPFSIANLSEKVALALTVD